MRSLIHFIGILILFSVLVSCKNALYFYETDKISLTVEARPDSSQPVQGNFGLKQRIALITPSKNNEGGGEALSVITSFRFNKEPGGIFDLGAVTIKTAFITGEAASDLSGKAVGAATAIVGTNTVDSGVDISVMRNIIDRIKKDKGNPETVKLLNQLNKLGNGINPAFYPVTLYSGKKMGAFRDLQASHKLNTITSLPSGIDGTLTYWGKLGASVKTLKNVLKVPQGYRFNGKIPNDPLIISGLSSALNKTETEIIDVRRELVNNPIYLQTIQFYIDNYL